MKAFVYIALAVFFGAIVVQGYGPKIQRKNIGGPSKFNRPHSRPPHGPPHGPPQRSHHHGFPHHWPHYDHFRPPHRWDDDYPVWNDGRRDDSGESEDDSYDSINSDRDSSDSSYEDSGDWHDHHKKPPCKKPHTKKPPIIHTTTERPRPPTQRPRPTTPEPRPTTPEHRPTTPKPIPTTTESVAPIPPITNRPTTPTHWETTTDVIPETTTSNPDIETTTEEEFITISPEMIECINSCPSTPEFNPVCGSDGTTYDNEGKLFCASACGVNVTLQRRSVCPPPNFDYDDVEPPGPPPPTVATTTTTPPFNARTTPVSGFQRCMNLCRITASFTPVCGTDLITYMNIDRLHCAQSCGEAVEVLCEKACPACGFNPATVRTTTSTTTVRPRTSPPVFRTTTQEPIQDPVQECIKACPVTPEYNPVCGSDHITYSNPGHLLCAQLCGVAVAVTRLGPCGPTTTTSTTTEAVPTTLSPTVLNCIRRCPVTSEYNPVCGTDDLTYNNEGHLHCAAFCGVEVSFKHKSRCFDEFDLGTDGTDSTPSPTTKEINGDKDPEIKPWPTTATTPSIFTSPTTTSTAIPPTTPTSRSTIREGTTSSSTVGFTIPRDVLIDIFGSTTPQTTVTKPTNPDEDEDLDLDARYNNDTDTDKDKEPEERDPSYYIRLPP